MKQSEEYRSRHSMEVPGKSTEVPGGCTEVPDDCQELPWSRKKSLYGCHENAAWQQPGSGDSDPLGQMVQPLSMVNALRLISIPSYTVMLSLQ